MSFDASQFHGLRALNAVNYTNVTKVSMVAWAPNSAAQRARIILDAGDGTHSRFALGENGSDRLRAQSSINGAIVELDESSTALWTQSGWRCETATFDLAGAAPDLGVGWATQGSPGNSGQASGGDIAAAVYAKALRDIYVNNAISYADRTLDAPPSTSILKLEHLAFWIDHELTPAQITFLRGGGNPLQVVPPPNHYWPARNATDGLVDRVGNVTLVPYGTTTPTVTWFPSDNAPVASPDVAPVITGPAGAAGAASITHSALEGQNVLGQWTATGTGAWSVSGPDAGLLTMTNGVVSLTTGTLDFETKPTWNYTVNKGTSAQAVTTNLTNVVEISEPTRSTPTSVTAAPGFTTDIGTGEARCVLIAATSPPATPTAAQVKAGQNASGTTSGVVACAPLTITSAGAKVFAPANVTSGLTYYPFKVHTANGIDSAVLAGLPHYPGTGRTVADISAAGYTPSAGGSLSAMLSEDTASDATFITSPTLTGSFVGGPIMALSQVYGAGNYNNFRVRKWVDTGAGEFRIDFLNDAGDVVGSTPVQAMSTTPTTYTLSMTLSGNATRVQLFERAV